MKLKYNNQEVKKIKYNGQYIDKLIYNGNEFTFNSFNDEALQSFTNRPTISTSIKNVDATVNLHNGNLKISIPDIAFGNYALGIVIGHIYNAMMDNDNIYKAKWTFMGTGMKINYQQYLIEVNDNLYYYIDGVGVKHEIIPATNGTTLYDTSGLGLILTVSTNLYTLTDRENNQLLFNRKTGFIKEITNNLGHKIEIFYINDRISSIINTIGTKTRTMSFEYDEIDRLSEVKYDGAKKTVIYSYKTGTNLLEKITKKINNVEELVAKMYYNDSDKLFQIVNVANQAIKITYLNGKVSKIQDGIINNDTFVTAKNQSITYNYGNTEVATTLADNISNYIDTENRVRIVYQYDFNGMATTTYEKYNNNITSIVPPSNFGTRLLRKIDDPSFPNFNGVCINDFSDSDDVDYVVGGKNEYRLHQKSNGQSGDKSDNIGAIIDLINATKDYKRTYTFSFWCKITKHPTRNLRFRVYTKKEKYFDKLINITDSEWHYISVEKRFNAKTEVEYITLYLVAEKGEKYSVQIADVRAIQNTVITKINNKSAVDIRKINKIKYDDKSIEIKDIRDVANSNENFITPRDIIWNEFEKAKGNDLFYINNGKKLFSLEKANKVIFEDEDKQTYDFVLSDLATPFLFNEIIKDKDTTIKSWAYYACIDGDYCLTEKTTGKVSGKTETRVIKRYDKCMRVWEEIDEYNVETRYSFDDFGKLTKKRISKMCSSELTITENYTNDENGNLSEKQNIDFTKNEYQSDGIYGTLKSITDGNKRLKVEYGYNSMMEKVSTIKYLTGTNYSIIYSSGEFIYNNRGLVDKFTRSDGQTYSFDYDKFGNLENYKINDKIVQKKETIYNPSGVEKRSKLANEYNWNIEKYDIYGRLSCKGEIVSNSYVWKYENVFSDKAGFKSDEARLDKAIDHYSGITHKFNYDINDSLYKHSFSGNEIKGSIEAFLYDKDHPKNAICYQYSVENETFVEEIYYDKNKCINPRVIKERVNYGFFANYEYDALGRIDIIQKKDTHFENTVDFKKITINYRNILDENKNIVATTCDIEKMIIEPGGENCGDRTKKIYKMTYDNNHNILSISESTNDNNHLLEYEYDELNRLIKEKNQTANYSRSYSYDKFGNREISKKTDYSGNKIDMSSLKHYSYNDKLKDRLENITSSYDSSLNRYFEYESVDGSTDSPVGNPIKYKVKSIDSAKNMTWTRGNILEQYIVDGSTINFKYDVEGNRIEKQYCNGSTIITTKQYLDGAKVYAETKKFTDKSKEWKAFYFYDSTGVTSMFIITEYGPKKYYFQKDALGNIVKIYFCFEFYQDLVAEYSYDAFGNCQEIFLNEYHREYIMYNPFRWKGHYYDYETKLYYINGNYYDPETGRYVNCNNLADIVTNNSKLMESTYCLENNNPIMYTANLDTNKPHFKLNVEFKKKSSGLFSKILMIVGIILLIVSIILAIISFIAPPAMCGSVTLFRISIGLLILTNTALLICATADTVEAFTNKHFIRRGTGLGKSNYDKIKLGLTIASIVLSITTAYIARCQCFKKGTLVSTENGKKLIEEIEVGDLVWAYNEETGDKSLKKVVKFFRNEPILKDGTWIGGTKKWIHITVDSNKEEIVCTPGHKFYLPDNIKNRSRGEKLEHISYADLSVQWVSAEHLKPGDRVLLADGNYGIINSVVVEELETPECTYNFEVEDYHTYYVGETGVLCHNMNCGGDVIDNVIDETLAGNGNITSKYSLTEQQALEAGERFLGKNYTEIGKPGSGVFRSGDRIFRIDTNSLQGLHNPGVPHFHLEILNSSGARIVNNHIPFLGG